MNERLPARQRFTQLVARDDDFDLARAALYLAQEEYPELDVERYIGVLDEMASNVAAKLRQDRNPEQVVDALRAHLFDELGFVGNTGEYYDPRNSFLNEVIDRRTGIPITLSVVFLEVGWRLGVPVVGVGLPGHFVVKVERIAGDGDMPLVLDPFNRGRVLGAEDCARLAARMSGGTVPFQSEQLEAVSRRQIVTRLLNNLKAIYVKNGDDDRAIAAVDRLLVLDPMAAAEVRDRAMLEGRRGRYSRALDGLARYLELSPSAPDRQPILEQMAQLRQAISRLN